MTFEQEVKLQLVVLSEYLQCPPLSDIQIKLYANELIGLGPEGLRKAITLLKEDPEVWSGRMPLPAKLKQYVSGDMAAMAAASARQIMAMNSVPEAYEKLSPMELEVAKSYGLKAITARLAEQSPTIFAQLRDSLKHKIRTDHERKVIGLLDDHQAHSLGSAKGSHELSHAGETAQLETGSGESDFP